jgi:hypothetical protein
MNVKIQNEILKSKTFNLFQGETQNNIYVLPDLFRYLIWALDLI